MIKDLWYKKPNIIKILNEKNEVVGQSVVNLSRPSEINKVYKSIIDDPFHYREIGYPFEYGFIVAKQKEEDDLKIITEEGKTLPFNEDNLRMSKQLYLNPTKIEDDILNSVFEFPKEQALFYMDIVSSRLKYEPLTAKDREKVKNALEKLKDMYHIENDEQEL